MSTHCHDSYSPFSALTVDLCTHPRNVTRCQSPSVFSRCTIVPGARSVSTRALLDASSRRFAPVGLTRSWGSVLIRRFAPLRKPSRPVVNAPQLGLLRPHAAAPQGYVNVCNQALCVALCNVSSLCAVRNGYERIG